MTEKQENSFQEKVKQVLSNANVNDEGKYELPDNLDDALRYAVTAEIRRRGTQASYTRAKQKIQLLEDEKSKIVENWEKDYAKVANSENSAELQELKEIDPDAYIEKKVENEIKTKENFKQINDKIKDAAALSSEVYRRQILLEEYNRENPQNPLTDELIRDNVPPRLVKDLESGNLEFSDFITLADKYIKSDKSVVTNKPENNVAFNQSASSNTTSLDVEEITANDYKKYIF